MKRKLHLTTLLIFVSVALWAQDIHYSQFENAPLNYNPALTGVFRGDIRFAGNFRYQWPTVPVDYTTFTAMADMKFLRADNTDESQTGFFAGGLSFNYDQAGVSKLSNINLGLNFSYIKMMTRKFYASFGVQVAAAQRNFDLTDLTFDNQFNTTTGLGDPTLPTGENFPSTRNSFLDFSAGLNFRYQNFVTCTGVDLQRNRTRVDFGIGIYHLNQPDQSFLEDDEARLSIRLSPYVMGLFKVGESWDIAANVTTQFQKPYREYLLSAGPRVYFDRTPGKQFSAQVMLGLRLNDQESDAWWPAVFLFYKNWQADFTYDFNISEFNVATKGWGGPELTVRYFISKIRYNCNVCPLI